MRRNTVKINKNVPAIPKTKGVIACIHSFPFKMFRTLVDRPNWVIIPAQARAHARDAF